MAFDKMIPSKITEYKIYDVDSTEELEKVASDDISFPEGVEYDPDFLYLWVRIVSAGEYYGPNKNADFFPEDELIAFYESFREAHPFKNHENKKIESAIGKIITVRWNPQMKCVEVLKAIDRKRAPEIVRGYQKGYLTDVSMGCKVPYTVCSVCGNKARRRSEFCDHVKKYRNQTLGNGERVYEINYKPKFHDSSTVLNGAERVAKAFFIIDEPNPHNYIEGAFRKAASSEGDHFIPYTDQELEKIADYKDNLHPLLKPYDFEKVAASDPMLKKIAEIQKEITGKLMNVVSTPNADDQADKNKMLEVIKFLTEKRMDEDTLETIARSLKTIAKENGVKTADAFSTFVGVAELMGIEFFPHELHTLLRGLTDAQLNEVMKTRSAGEGELYPGDYIKKMERVVPAYSQNRKSFSDPSVLLSFYDDVAHKDDVFVKDPVAFYNHCAEMDTMNSRPSSRMIKVIEDLLTPYQSFRSHHPEHLYPRLALVAGGHQPIIGDAHASRDLDIMFSPSSPGEAAAGLAYSNYEEMRPGLLNSLLVKVAADAGVGMEKTAAPSRVASKSGRFGQRVRDGIENVGDLTQRGIDDVAARTTQATNSARSRLSEVGKNMTARMEAAGQRAHEAANARPKPKGMKYRHLAMAGVPAAYGASAFQQNRREHGRHLSDAENFVADNPGLIAGGVIVGGKPLTRAAQKASRAGTGAVGGAVNKVKAPFSKMSEEESALFDGLVKVADEIDSGAFDVFEDHEVSARYMSETGSTGDQASAVKMATLLSYGGMEKEAKTIREHYNFSPREQERLLKIAADYLDEEMSKAAGDFANNMALSLVADQSPLARSLPGRMVDAYIFKKLGDLGKEPKSDASLPLQQQGGKL